MASGAAVSSRYSRIRLRDASSETLKNSEPMSESVISESARSSTACMIVS